MKKIMIMLALAISAATVQAAFVWNTLNEGAWDAPPEGDYDRIYAADGKSLLYDSAGAVMVCLFVRWYDGKGNGVGQHDIVLGLRDGANILDFNPVATQRLGSDSRLTDQTFEYDNPSHLRQSNRTGDWGYETFMAIVDGGNVYLSDGYFVYPSEDGETGERQKTNISNLSELTKEWAQGEDTYGFCYGGWYSIPEPTSGLLMLVGLGGLALRRRRT